MTLPTRTLQRKAGGWNKLLFSEFEARPIRPEAKRVEKILRLLVTAEKQLNEWRSPIEMEGMGKSEFLRRYRRTSEATRGYYNALTQLNAVLKRYHWRSTITGNIDGFTENLELTALRPYSVWECAVVRVLLDRTKKPGGTFSQFRQCSECRRWFYAATNHQRFCGDSCRKRHASRNPEFKEKRRRYMRDVYRPQQKRRDQASREFVRSTSRKKERVK